MMMERCLYCYKELAEGEKDFHKACSKKIFGTSIVPELPYTRENLSELAKQVIRSQTTLTGVQAKLSLDIDKGEKEAISRFMIVGLWGRYILKPQADRFANLPEIEDLTMHLAELWFLIVSFGSRMESFVILPGVLTVHPKGRNSRWRICAN